MMRLLFIAGAVLGVLWLLSASGVLPAPMALAVDFAVGTACSLACPLFFLSLYVAPGLYREASDSVRQFWERLRVRRFEVEELERKIAHLDKPHHMVQLGQVYVRQGRPAKAVPWLEKALQKDPQSLDARYGLAICNFNQARFQQASELLEQVHSVKPDHDYGQAYLRLAQAHHRLNNTPRAGEVYSTLLRFYPAHPEGAYHYALLLAAQGETERARQLMRDVVYAVRHSPRFHRRRNRHWVLKSQCWLWRHRG